MAEYEWDEAKREANIAKHGIDFLDAHQVYESDFKVTTDVTRASDGEPRWADLACVQSLVLKFVYTYREGVVRPISIRVASRTERGFYETAKHRALHR
jgi:uncharacterized DUF497 family protein